MCLAAIKSKPDSSVNSVNFFALKVMLFEIVVFKVSFKNMLLVDSAVMTASRNITGQNIRPPLKLAFELEKDHVDLPRYALN